MVQPVSSNACPDCGGAFRPIELFGRGQLNPASGEAVDSAVIYYAEVGAAPRSTWAPMLQEKGHIRACMCQSCHRVFLYAIPQSEGGTQHVKIDKPLVKGDEAERRR